MTSRERVRRAFEHEKSDRVPLGYDTNPIARDRLAAHLGLAAGDREGLLRALGIDERGVGARFVGKERFSCPPGERVEQVYGSRTRYIANESGGYWDTAGFPLRDAPGDVIANWPIADADEFDYAAAAERARSLADYSLSVGGPGTPDVINGLTRLMGMEETLVRLYEEDEATLAYLRRRADFQIACLERLLDACEGLIDVLWLGEDLGTQIAPMISGDMYDRVLRPIHARFIEFGRARGLKTLMHTCGSSSWAYERFIDMGLDGVDTLQPEAARMSPEYLVEKFGGRLAFRGCISTAGALAYGAPEDVERDVGATLAAMMPTRSYILAPTHAIQDNTPPENIVAMYRAARLMGRY